MNPGHGVSEGYEVGTSVTLTAFHRMPGAPGPEGELHPHDYRVEVVVARGALDERGVVCDLDVLDEALRQVARSIEGKDLEVIRPASVDAVTVEVLARWAHGALAEPVRLAGGEALSVRVWESPMAFGGYSGPLA